MFMGADISFRPDVVLMNIAFTLVLLATLPVRSRPIEPQPLH
jgi:hypothetical protein